MPERSRRLFKFLRKKDLHYVTVSNTLKLASPEYYEREYQGMEVKDPKINDPNEGVLVHIQDRDIDSSVEITERERILLDRFVGPNVQGKFSRNVFSSRVGGFHMLCLCLGELEELVATFRHVPGPDGSVQSYDACVEIIDEQGLGTQILRHSTVVECPPRVGTPLKKYVSQVGCANVVYEPIVHSWRSGPLDPSPFRKDPSFADQRERRMIFPWRPSLQAPGSVPETLLVYVPDLNRFIREVPLD